MLEHSAPLSILVTRMTLYLPAQQAAYMPQDARLLPRIFTLDPRSLAAFRIGVGALILIDLFQRYADLTAFYTDKGVLPRSLLTLGQPGNWQWSFHAWSGTAEFQTALFVLAAVAGLSLMIGYRTTLASFVSWLFLISIHTRNPLIINAGDTYIALLTFWSIFLPMGRVWSLDARRNPLPAESQIYTAATVALCLQVFFLYFSTAVLKCQSESWQSGDAIAISLSKDYLITFSGRALSSHDLFLKWLTWGTLLFEFLGPIALLLTKSWTRLAVIGLFIIFHLGLVICFSIGLFPYVCIVALFAFLPSEFWNWMWGEPRLVHQSTLQPSPSRMTRYAQTLSRIVLLLAMTIATWSGLNSLVPAVGMPEGVRQLSRSLRWGQKWQMFVNPAENRDGWFVFDARFVDGSSSDLLTGASPVSSVKPNLTSAMFKNFRWRKFCVNLLSPKYQVARTGLGVYLLLERDRVHHDVHRLKSLEICFLSPNEPQKTVLYEWQNKALKYQDAFIRE
jgi:hypothetical protein